MLQWEYTKRDLSHLPPRTDAVDVLNDCGRGGWELVAIIANGTAYFRRAIPAAPKPRVPRKSE